LRVIRAAKNLRKDFKSSVEAFEKYCTLTSIGVDEQQFCYNAFGIKKDIHKLLELGADETRICKRVMKINPDFCLTTKTVEELPGTIDTKFKKGVIYE
jgi:hypothetical protein